MLRLFLECAIRSALIAAGTGAVLAILGVKTARSRHTAWAGVVVSMLLLPVWTAWGPKAPLRVLPAPPALAVQSAVPTASVSSPRTPAAEFHLETARPARPAARYGWTFLAGLYLLGVAVLLGRLAIGTLRAARFIQKAVIREGRLTSPSCAAPVTVGWLHPTVILPEGWREWPRNQLDAVLAHEREHARRHDPLVQWLALLNRAVFWFHPLAWYLERRLSGLAEEACDAAVLAQGHDPYEYSNCLLEMARTVVRSGVRVQVLGMAMPGSSLTKRIRQILDARPAPRLTRLRMACAATACAVLSTVFAAGAVDRQRAIPALARVGLPNVDTPKVEPPARVAVTAPQPPDARTNPVTRPARLLAQAQATPPPLGRGGPPEETRYRNRRLLTMYFDLAEMTEADLTRAVTAAQKFVRTDMQSRDLIAIMTCRSGGEAMVSQDFTDDHELLVRTLQKLIGSQSSSVSGGVSSADRRSVAIRTAAQMLDKLDGKKMLLLFVSGSSNASDTQEERQAANDAAVRGNVAVYFIDVRGVVIAPR